MLETFKPANKINKTPLSTISSQEKTENKDPEYDKKLAFLTDFIGKNHMPDHKEVEEELVRRFYNEAVTKLGKYRNAAMEKTLRQNIADFMSGQALRPIRQADLRTGTPDPERQKRIQELMHPVSSDEAPKQGLNPDVAKQIARKTDAWREYIAFNKSEDLHQIKKDIENKIAELKTKYAESPEVTEISEALKSVVKDIDGLGKTRDGIKKMKEITQ